MPKILANVSLHIYILNKFFNNTPSFPQCRLVHFPSPTFSGGFRQLTPKYFGIFHVGHIFDSAPPKSMLKFVIMSNFFLIMHVESNLQHWLSFFAENNIDLGEE